MKLSLHTAFYNEDGTTLLSVLFVSSLLLATASYSALQAYQTVRDSSELITILRARERATFNAIDAFFTSTGNGGSPTLCHRKSGESGEISIYRDACGLYLQHTGTVLPFVDLSVTHPVASLRCERVPFSIELSESSVRSSATCIFDSKALSESYSGPDNMVVQSPLSLGLSHSVKPIILYARGFLSLQNGLQINGDVILLALGDIYISSLTIGEESSAIVTSITGRITIGSFSGSPRIKLSGKKGVFAPTNLVPHEVGLFPVIRAPILLSITAPRE